MDRPLRDPDSQTRAVPMKPSVIATPAVALLLLGAWGCASAGAPPGPLRAITVEVDNDVAPSADVEVFLYPVGGDNHDRIRMGILKGGSRGEFDVTVREGGWYYLRAARVLEVSAVDYPVSRPRATSLWNSRRFTVPADTRRVEWRITTNSLAIKSDEPGG